MSLFSFQKLSSKKEVPFKCIRSSRKTQYEPGPAGKRVYHRGKTEFGPMMSRTTNVSTVFNICQWDKNNPDSLTNICWGFYGEPAIKRVTKYKLELQQHLPLQQDIFFRIGILYLKMANYVSYGTLGTCVAFVDAELWHIPCRVIFGGSWTFFWSWVPRFWWVPKIRPKLLCSVSVIDQRP